MKRVINFISKNYNYKMVIGLVAGLLIASTGAYAITVASNTVTYDNTNSGLTSTNVQSAIDELYAKSNTLKATVGLYRNSNIVKVMKYDQTENSPTLCITGNENTCEELAPTISTTYAAGTIVKYKVNSSTTRTFYVLHDDGSTLTLQDRENIVNQTEWYSSDDNTKGPTTALEALESATNGWSNVESQTYTMGTTNFNGTNAYTGCSASSGQTLTCDRNSGYGYTLPSRTAKARMITGQETAALGCKYETNGSCPTWMHNYLNSATSYGGTNTGTDYGYWTMSASSSNSYYAWYVYYYGHLTLDYTTYTGFGVRPVVVIKK